MGAKVQQAVKAKAVTSDCIIYDSGTFITSFNSLKWFTELHPLAEPITFTVANSSEGKTHYMGSVQLPLKDSQGRGVKAILPLAYYVPETPINLVSTSSLKQAGMKWDMDDNTLLHKPTGTLIPMRWAGELPQIPTNRYGDLPEGVTARHAVLASINYRLMHRRLMHAGKEQVIRACKEAGIKLFEHNQAPFCEPCAMAKAHDEMPKHAAMVTKRACEYIRVDLVTESTTGHLGYKYMVHFMCMSTAFRWGKFTKDKSDAFTLLTEFVTWLEKQTGRSVKVIGVDGGTEFGFGTKEFQNSKLVKWGKARGTTIFKTTKHTPWMNGGPERSGRVIMERARAVMIEHNIPWNLWPFIFDSVIKVLNLLPTRSNSELYSPTKAMQIDLGLPEDNTQLRHLRSYFCAAYYYIKPANRVQAEKLAPRARKGRLLGYGDQHGRIYWIWDPETKEIIYASAVQFNEDDHKQDDLGHIPHAVSFAESTVEEAMQAEDLYTTVLENEKEGSNKDQGRRANPDELEAPETPESVPRPPTPPKKSAQRYPTPDTPINKTLRLDHFIPNTPIRESIEGQLQSTPGAYPASDGEEGDVQAELATEDPIPPTSRVSIPFATLDPTRRIREPRVRFQQEEEQDEQEEGSGNNEERSAEPEGVSIRPRRAAASKPPGHYKKLHEGKLKQGGSFVQAYMADERVEEPRQYVLSTLQVNHILATVGNNRAVPKNLRDAKKRDNYETYWLPAMRLQGDGLKGRGVYRLEDEPQDQRVLPGKWVFDEKMDPKTCEWSARARWVVCGNFDDSNWGVEDLYAAVANTVSVKTFLALTAVHDLECYQFDFKLAFLNATIPEGEIYYMEQPPGLPQVPGKVWRLIKALYGLRKSPHYWFNEVRPVMIKLGFEPFGSDTCLFRHKVDGTLLLLYVDDLLMAAPSKKTIDKHSKKLQEYYEIKELGEAARFLGLDIIRDRKNRKIFLSQEAFVDKMLEKYGLENLNSVKTPWKPGFELPKVWDPIEGEVKSYIKKTGSLNWLSTGTRPDISYTVSRLCEANSGPSQQHLDLLHHLFRYIKGTKALGLSFGGIEWTKKDMGLVAFADAAYADDPLTRFSTGGHVVFVAGGPVLWKTMKQSFVVTSSTEAEFTNLTPTCKSVLWITDLLKEAGLELEKPTVMYTDSVNARHTVLNPLESARTRAIDTRYKYIIDQVKRGGIRLLHIPGTQMVADGLTKPLGEQKHNQFVKTLAMVARQVPWNAQSGAKQIGNENTKKRS